MEERLTDKRGHLPAWTVDVAFLLVVYGASRAFYYFYIGIEFDATTVPWFIQFIDPVLLKERLLESLLYYHSGSPLLNLFTGVVMKLFPGHETAVFWACFSVMGVVFTLSMYYSMRWLGVNRGLSLGIVSVYISGPGVVLYENWLMYTFPAATLLVASAALLPLGVTGRRVWPAHAAFILLALAALMRPFFHLAWMLVVICIVLMLCRDRWKRLLSAAVVPLMLVTLWYGKNLIIFDQFSASSLVGFSLANVSMLTVPKEKLSPLVKDGTLSRYALVSRYADSYLFASINTRPWGVPVLDNAIKSTGYVNFNYRNIPRLSSYYASDAVKVAFRFPGNYLGGVARANVIFFSTADINTYFSERNRRLIEPVKRIYDPVVFMSSPDTNHLMLPHFGPLPYRISWLMLLGMPAVMLYSAWLIIGMARRWELSENPKSVLLAFMLFTSVYIYVLGSWIELGENYRYRFLGEPFSFALMGMAVNDVYRWLVSTRQKYH